MLQPVIGELHKGLLGHVVNIAAVVATAIGVAYGAAELFSVSFALGAFFAGVVMRESEFSHRAASESLPLQDAFSVLFFVSVGMLFEPAILIQEPMRVLGVVAIIIIGKSLAAMAIVLALRLLAMHFHITLPAFGQPKAP